MSKNPKTRASSAGAIAPSESISQHAFMLEFAKKVNNQMIFDPKNPNQRSSSTFSKFTREQITSWLQNPETNDASIRNASIYMYNASPHYNKLVNYYARLPIWAYVISPVGFEGADEVDLDEFKSSFFEACKLLEGMNVPDIFTNAATIAIKEGVLFGVRWKTDTGTFVQRIDPKLCRITYVSNGVFYYAVDMSKINKDDLNKYHPEFTKMYNASKRQGGASYQQVPESISFCLKFDSSIKSYSTPIFAASIPQLYRVADTEAREDISADQQNYKLITARLPSDDKGRPVISDSEALLYYQHISKNLGNSVGLAMTPFDLDTIAFEKSGSLSEIDQMSRAMTNFWQTAGVPAQLFGISNNTSGALKLSIQVDEAVVKVLFNHAERLLNQILLTELSGKTKFKVSFLRATVFNYQDMLKTYREATSFGLCKSHYAALLGVPVFDIAGIDLIEKEAVDIDTILTPLKNTYNTAQNEAGRPSVDATELTDSGEATRESDANENRG